MTEFYETANITCFSVAITAITVILAILLLTLKNRGLPSGPTGVPFLGYYPFLREDFHVQLQEMTAKYGDVFSINITGQLYIHIGSIKAFREAHVTKGDCFQRRIERYNLLKYAFGNGMSFMVGHEWKVLRKFYVQNLKDYFLTSLKGNLGGSFHECLIETIEDIVKTEGKSFDATAMLTKQCNKTMRQLLFSGVETSDEDLHALNAAYSDVMGGMRTRHLILAGPLAEYIMLPLTAGHRELIRGKNAMEKILFRIVKDHESSFDEDHPRDLIDRYIRERNVRTRNNDPTASYFTDVELVSMLIQLIGDGVLLVSFFTSKFLKSFAEHPEVQEKVFKELSEVVGPDRQPSLDDKSRLPYCNAAILEILRVTNPRDILPSLQCTQETTLNGYRIPKGSVTLINNYAMYHDPVVYEDPHTFDPMRFMAEPDKPKAETPRPFGLGKRACAAESFVMMQFFLSVLTIVKKFKLSRPRGTENQSDWSCRKRDICAEIRR